MRSKSTNRSVVEGVDRKRPGRPGGSAGFENGRDVLSPVRLVQRSDQEISRDAGRCRCGAGVVAAALHGEEPGDPRAMNAAEPVRGASPHRVPDEKDGNVRQLRMQTLRAEVGECLKQRFIARRVVDQGGRSNERHVSAGELRVRDSLPPLSRPETPDTACSAPRCHARAHASPDRYRWQGLSGQAGKRSPPCTRRSLSAGTRQRSRT